MRKKIPSCSNSALVANRARSELSRLKCKKLENEWGKGVNETPNSSTRVFSLRPLQTL